MQVTLPGDTTSVLDVVARLLSVYAAGDLEQFERLLDPDVVYTLYLEETGLPFAGTARGRSEFMSRIAAMRDQFEYLLYRPMPAAQATGDTVRCQVEFMYRHKASGEILSGRFRLVITGSGGIVRQIDEFHDVERVRAFVRLTGGAEQP